MPGTAAAQVRTPRAEHGFTVVEVAIVALISSLLLGSILGILDGQSRAERRVTAVADNQELVRQAMVSLQRDLRSAAAIVGPETASSAAWRVDLVHLDFDTGTRSQLRWRLDVARRELVRESVAGSSVGATTFRLTGVDPQPMLRYFDARGRELTGGGGSTSTLASCTARVRVQIAAAPSRGPAPLAVSSEVELRNRRRHDRVCTG
jgi:Tfp pilus assembly protein PilW